ncbi:MAG: serine/threonine-protein kinase, partial [Myxococcota bacterium]
MKCCPECQRLYADDASFCPIDGARLLGVDAVPLAGDPEDPRVGTVICGGRFEVRRRVADGGMGRVYQGRDLTTGRNVAIKVLHDEVVVDQVSLERFRREYQLSAELPHDHIVEVVDFLPTEDRSYALAMEYLEGEELAMALKREKTVSPARLIRILSQLAVGLRLPHERKFVHRDIKPDNIFLCHTEEGPVVKLLDFGSVRDNTEGAKKLTVVGTTIGSP